MVFQLSDGLIKLVAVDETNVDDCIKMYLQTSGNQLPGALDINDALLTNLAKQQAMLQHYTYKDQYKQASFFLVMKDEEPIGRFYFDDKFEDGSIRIIDLRLLPKFQNQGIGSNIIKDVLNYATAMGRPVSLHVEKNNSAVNLYLQLGFRISSSANALYYFMVWNEYQKH